MTRRTTGGTWPRAARAASALFGLSLLAAACGGGSGGKTAPTSLSLHGDKIPVATLTSDLKGLCTVTHQAQNAVVAKNTYFSGPYAGLHQLAGILHGSQTSQLLTGMDTFERDVLGTAAASSTVQAANDLLGIVDRDLQSLKVAPIKC
jgi:hypothetical protein